MDEKTIARFWAKVDKSGGPEACWLWTASRNVQGYGKVTVDCRDTSAHRLSFEINSGPIGVGMFVLHRCDNPPCVNPAHLFLGTPADNMHDRDKKGRHVSCPGELHGMAQLTESDVRIIRKLAANGVSQSTLAKTYGTTQPNISHIVHRRSWAHVA